MIAPALEKLSNLQNLEYAHLHLSIIAKWQPVVLKIIAILIL